MNILAMISIVFSITAIGFALRARYWAKQAGDHADRAMQMTEEAHRELEGTLEAAEDVIQEIDSDNRSIK